MKTNLLILCWFFCIFKCHSNDSYREVMDVIDEYSLKIKIEKKIDLRMYGLDYAGQDKIYDGKIHLIDLGYSINKNMKYEEARELFYSVIDGLINRINKTEKIKNYFSHSPIGYEDFYFRLSFDYESEGHLKKDDVKQIAILDNQIMYFIVDEEGTTKIKKNDISPDIHIIDGFSPKTRSIVKKLPESQY